MKHPYDSLKEIENMEVRCFYAHASDGGQFLNLYHYGLGQIDILNKIGKAAQVGFRPNAKPKSGHIWPIIKSVKKDFCRYECHYETESGNKGILVFETS